MTQERHTEDEGRRGRESVWSIDPGSRIAFFVIFVVKMVIWTILIALEEIQHGGHSGARVLAIAVAQEASPLIVVSVASTVTLLQGVEFMIVSRDYLRDRFVRPIVKAHEARGQAIGRSEMYEEWDAWNRRRLAAEAEGLPFDEPSPTNPDAEHDRSGQTD